MFSLHAPQSEDVLSVFPVFNSCFSAWALVRLWTWSRTRLRLYGVLRQVTTNCSSLVMKSLILPFSGLPAWTVSGARHMRRGLLRVTAT